jgi:hypothetical protein
MRIFDYEGIHKKLAEEMGCDYVSGSLRELAGLRDQFEGRRATVYLLGWGGEPSKERSIPAVEEKAKNATTKEEVWIDTRTRFCSELRGSGIPGVVEAEPRKYRFFSAFQKEMFERIISRISSSLNDIDFVKLYFFSQMSWNGREIEHIYFNNEDESKIFLQCKPQPPV